jgi:hypothetical protein
VRCVRCLFPRNETPTHGGGGGGHGKVPEEHKEWDSHTLTGAEDAAVGPRGEGWRRRRTAAATAVREQNRI